MVFLLMLAGICASTPAAPLPHLALIQAAATNSTYDLMEWHVDLGKTYSNPFDPDEISVDGLFKGPQGKVLRVPAFWGQDFETATNAAAGASPAAVGDPGWRLRFAPPAPGHWTLRILARDAGGETNSETVSFEVVKGGSPGFVRRSLCNSRYFEFDSGSPFFILGYILGWGTLPEYDLMLGKIAAAGGNYTRVWISPPNPVLETQSLGPGRYDLAAAWFYDQVLGMARSKGVYVLLTLKNYRDLMNHDVWGPAPWPQLPYNRVNGGPISEPSAFFTDPAARRLYQRHLRYLVARYSAFTSLGFWEFWNEQDNAGAGSDAGWVVEMADWLRQNDPNRHLVTTSYGRAGPAQVWEAQSIDLTQRHFYGDEGSVRNVVPVIEADARAADRFGKPHLMSELGISWRRSDEFFDPHHTAMNLHCGLWASAMAGNAGGATMWYWYDYIRPHNLWGNLIPLSRFAAGINWSRLNLQPVAVESPRYAGPAGAVREVSIAAGGDWGKADPAPCVVEPDGRASRALPIFLYGPVKPELRTPLVVTTRFDRPGTLAIRAAQSSGPCRLEVSVDGGSPVMFDFKPEPLPVGKASSEAMEGRYPVAETDRERRMPLPEGAHTLRFDVTEGDWIALESVSLAGVRDPGVSGLEVLALADAEAGEAIAWVHDPEANWYTEARNVRLPVFGGTTMQLPLGKPGSYRLEWWDTYLGYSFKLETLKSRDGLLRIEVPAFQRDVAVRISRER